MLMEAQHRLKQAVKPLFVRGGRVPRRVRSGPARGVLLVLDRRTGLQVELGLYESELSGIYREYVRPESVVWDVGAGDGATALLYANLGAFVVAWEPDPAALDRFAENLRLNPELAQRIELVPDPFASSAEVARPDFVKVDVEGAELDVLAGTPDARAILVETHSRSLEAQALALLRGRGYEARVIRNAAWRRLYPEYRPLPHNRWVLGVRSGSETAA